MYFVKSVKSDAKWLPPNHSNVCVDIKLLTYWGRATHICVTKLTIIDPDNGLSPGRRQVIIWTSAGILLIGPLGTNFNEIRIKIHTFSFKKFHLKMSFGKWRPFCLGLNMLRQRKMRKFASQEMRWTDGRQLRTTAEVWAEVRQQAISNFNNPG